MNIEMQPAAPDQKQVLFRLMELYCYDYSEFLVWPVSENALFCNEERFEQRWADAQVEKFFVRVDGHLAGFVLVHAGSHVTDNPQTHDMNEFFIMRGYRRRGIGRGVAQRVFDMHQSRWEVRVLHENLAAQSFWRSVLHEYSNGCLSEVSSNNQQWCGLIFSLDSAQQP